MPKKKKSSAVEFAYTLDAGCGFHLPLLNLTLQTEAGRKIEALALLDSGSPVNVMPRHTGEELGLDWLSAKILGPIGGAFQRTETRLAFVNVRILNQHPIRLAFAWASNDGPRLILGHIDFFQKFDVAFRGRDRKFEVSARGKWDF